VAAKAAPVLPATETAVMAIRDLKPAPYNPRRIDDASLAALTKSMERFGVVEPIVFNKRSGFVVGGHQRLRVLRGKKVQSVAVVAVDLDETEERALNVALNSSKLTGEFSGKLQELLAEIRRADERIFAELRLNELETSAEARVYNRDPNEAPATRAVSGTRAGDVYTLGAHRIICGDCTNADIVAKLLDGELVESLVTDPHLGAEAAHVPIANDDLPDYRAWFRSFLELIPWADYATFYIFMSGLELHSLRMAVDDAGLKWGDYLVWVKNALVLGRKDYNQRTEFVVAGDATAFPGDAPEAAEFVLYGWPQRHRFFGPDKRTNVLEFKKPLASKLHPTMKPVEMLQQLLEDGSPSGAIVYEPFAGSGSTIIACEMSGRVCRAVEIDPAYVDVAVRRWEEFTGEKASLARAV
jgi:DNA modification methylase